MAISLKVSEELVSHLECTHSVLQFEGETSLNKAVELASKELHYPMGYVEILIGILIEHGQFGFGLAADNETGLSKPVLKFIGSRDLDLDVFDLERLNFDVAGVSKRLADRLAVLKMDAEEANAPVRAAIDREKALNKTVAQLNSAREALGRRRVAHVHAERTLALAKQKVAEGEGRVAELVAQLNRQRVAAGLPADEPN